MSAELNVLSRVTLPAASGNQARALHTIVEDDAGNIYYSDEFNHSVVSLDPDGNTRWATQGFFYPKGIAIGWISDAGHPVQCLAVCDSWNGKIQFFHLDGRLIGSWNSAGDLRFKDVADIRYLTRGDQGDPKSGYWLVLDRENHRLCRMAPDGRARSQFGRRFDPLREADWAASLVRSLEDGPNTFDPLFYPDRILGRSEDHLFVWEPLPRHLKQIAGDNLHTISISAPRMGEWIAADAGGFISWSRSAEMLAFHDRSGSQVAEAKLQGKPVSSRASSAKIWVQQGTDLRQLECNIALTSSNTGRQYWLLESTTENAIHAFLAPDGPWPSALESLHLVEDALLNEAGELLSGLSGDRQASPVEPLQAALSKAEADVNLAVRDLSALLLPEFLNGRTASHDAASFLAALQNRSARVQKCLDDILLWRWSVQPETLTEPQRAVYARLQQIEESLQTVLKALDGANEVLLGISPDAAPAVRTGRERGFLREVDRIFVGDAVTNRLAHPNHLARTSDGHIFVTGWNQVLHLDPSGKMLQRFEGLQSPIGIAIDGADRTWVAEFAAGRLSVCEAKSRSFAPLNLSSESQSLGSLRSLRSPHGLCYRPDGWTLVADTGNSRILAVSATGDTRILTSRSVRETGQFWFPMAVFVDPSDKTGAFWVVDHRNHRLQWFDGDGNCGNLAREIGGRGIGKGHLMLPECARFLADGSLLVSQHRFNPVIKLFSRDGGELERQRVDYSPAGILEHDRFILIANVGGSDIRVYERR